MDSALKIYNSYTKSKEVFKPIIDNFVGLYVCGPTVYSESHLGHARTYTTFDLLFRYLIHTGYKVRYVRNITDVGHLENDVIGEGEDKLAKKARLEQLEPMEIAQLYTNDFHQGMEKLNNLPPSIEPLASGHIIDQIEFIQKIIDAGFAYESEGSVYFDVIKFAENPNNEYGKLSGRVVEELQGGSRDLDGQSEKRNQADFALWKKASPEHIMRWNSPWSIGFPGWHIECSAMSAKYLGEVFDIHGGGMDLQFPHHEAEIAQSKAGNHVNPANYWMHGNMLTLNGQKMGKSLGNAISLNQFFNGNHPLLEQAYSPQTIRFFILQGHYRSTLDFTNEALIASEKGLKRLMTATRNLNLLEKTATESTWEVNNWINECYSTLNDDLNSAMLIAQLFEGVSKINLMLEGKELLTPIDLQLFKDKFNAFIFDILGLKSEEDNSALQEQLIKILIDQRLEVRANKDWAKSDFIRDQLAEIGIILKDNKEGTTWQIQ